MATQTTTDEAQIRELIEQWRDAVRRKDLDAVMAHYAPELVAFDAWGELQNSLEVMRDHWRMCFEGHDGPIQFEHQDLHLAVGDRVAFARTLINMAGTMTDGTEHSFWGRGTICFEKIDGRWLVTHEHASAPLDPMTGKACMDLTP